MVLGVSGDDEDSHAAFKSKLGLPYTLLADDGNKVGRGRCCHPFALTNICRQQRVFADYHIGLQCT